MSKSYNRQKEEEKRILEAARHVCPLVPPGDIESFEEPDLTIKTSKGKVKVGIEVTELLRLKGENQFPPVQDERFHQEVIRLAEDYYGSLDAEPVFIYAGFLGDSRCKRENSVGWRRLANEKTGRRRHKMARSLAEFVKNHPAPMGGSLTFSKREMAGQLDSDTLPAGFEVVGISSPPDHWRSGESAAMPPLDREQLAAVIGNKNELLPKYRTKLVDTPIWLLIYSGLSVARGVPIPCSISEWRFTFDFERVLLFSGMDNRVFEIGRR